MRVRRREIKRAAIATLSAVLGCGPAQGDLLTPKCGAASSGAPAPCSDTWPNDDSSANSDPWLADHHDDLVVVQPRVLFLHFYNPITIDQATSEINDTLIRSLADGSRYHGFTTAFLQYQLAFAIDLTDHPAPENPTVPYGKQLPLLPDGSFDVAALFGPTFADLYKIHDANDPTRNLPLCELFERGLVNEVWLDVGGDTAPPGVVPIIERRQMYDASFRAIPGSFRVTTASQAQAQALETVGCHVTTRIVSMPPLYMDLPDFPGIGRDVGCSLMEHGFGIEAMVPAIPYLQVHARAFLNIDFRSRFHVGFDGWREICDSRFAPCVAYKEDPASGQWEARAAKDATVGGWAMNPFRQGCGTVDFPPNARFRWDFLNTDLDKGVDSRCDHYGLRDGADGGDAYEPYLPEPAQGPDDCGAKWQMHWRQSIPGFRNAAFNVDGGPMKNWWPFLFY